MTKKLLYAVALGQLDGGTLYFYDVAESFMTQLPYFPNAPAVDFEQLPAGVVGVNLTYTIAPITPEPRQPE